MFISLKNTTVNNLIIGRQYVLRFSNTKFPTTHYSYHTVLVKNVLAPRTFALGVKTNSLGGWGKGEGHTSEPAM